MVVEQHLMPGDVLPAVGFSMPQVVDGLIETTGLSLGTQISVEGFSPGLIMG